MAPTAKATTKKATTNQKTGATAKAAPKTTPTRRSDASQIREGVTKARHGAVSYVRTTAERGVDVPVGVALSVRDRVNEVVEPWTSSETREKELKSLRTQVTRELNKFERRGGQARRKATQRVRQTRNRFEREVRQRRRSVEKQVKQNRTKVEKTLKQQRLEVEKAVKENRAKAEKQLKKAQTVVSERVAS